MRTTMTLVWASAALCLASCSSSQPIATPEVDASPDVATSWEVVPGKSIGPITIGARYRDLKASYGEATGIGFNRLIFGRWPERKIEVVFASADPTAPSDDAIVIAIGTQADGVFQGPAKPGDTRATLEKAFGTPDVVGSYLYFPQGLSAKVSAPSDPRAAVSSVAVFAPYVAETVVAEMKPSTAGVGKALRLDASKVGVVDMHLHPGKFGRMPGSSKEFLVGSTPAFSQLYAPSIIEAALDPWSPFLGVRGQTDAAAVDHCLLYAVYTQKTTGWYTNEELEAALTDPRNVAKDGLPWAFGLASIDFFDGYIKADGTVDPAVSKPRLDALSSYFGRRRDLFVGIKLAHAHQAIAFDDARYLGVYDVAAKHGVPVYLHTGFSPFPGAKTERAYYDPEGLRNTIKNYPTVKFVLGHVGQGDQLAVDHSLALAVEFPNAFLEISALNRPILRDADGKDVPADKEKPQYPYVLAQVKEKGIVGKTIFGTDGPQFTGMVKGYVDLIVNSMKDLGYADGEIKDVMGGNFARVFLGG